mgnify:CR=1 FL=1
MKRPYLSGYLRACWSFVQAFFLAALLFLGLFSFPSVLPTSFLYEENVKRAVDFLVYAQYNPDLRLCREAPNAAPNVYWLLSDNLLAQYALKDYYPEISKAIHSELKRRGHAEDEHWDALLGKPIPVPNKKMMTLTIEQTENYTIKAHVRNEAEHLVDWAQYADRLLLHSLSLVWKGDIEQAELYFSYAKELWTGKGVMDAPQAQAGLYDTYKLSMLLLVSKVLEEPLPFQRELEQILWSLQRDDGGIFTHYKIETLEPGEEADANTETTAVTIIAYTYKKAGRLDVALIITVGTFIVATIVLILCIIYILYIIHRMKKKKSAKLQ